MLIILNYLTVESEIKTIEEIACIPELPPFICELMILMVDSFDALITLPIAPSLFIIQLLIYIRIIYIMI